MKKSWMAAAAIATMSLVAAPRVTAAEGSDATPATDEAKTNLDWFGTLRVRPEYSDNLADLAGGINDEFAYAAYRANLGLKANLDKGVSLVFDVQSLGKWGEDQTAQKGTQTQSNFTANLGLFTAYADAHHIFGQPISLRAGRQPLVFGDEWILGDSDFYGGTAWDGIRADFDHKLGSVSVFWAKIAELSTPELTVAPDSQDRDLYGVWSTLTFATVHTLDTAVLYDSDHRSLVAVGGPHFTDKRFTGTVRYHWGKDRGGFVNANGAYQWGGTTTTPLSTVQASIHAYAFEFTGGYVFDYQGRPYKLWGRVADYTGDKAATAADETFHDLAMDQHARYGYLDFWGGTWGLQPYLGGAPGFQALQIGFEASLPDGIRLTGIAQKLQTEQRVSPTDSTRNLGEEFAIVAAYDYGKNLSLELAFAQSYPGKAFTFVPPNFATDTARRVYLNTVVRF